MFGKHQFFQEYECYWNECNIIDLKIKTTKLYFQKPCFYLVDNHKNQIKTNLVFSCVFNNEYVFQIQIDFWKIDFFKNYYLIDHNNNLFFVTKKWVVQTKEFDKRFYYDQSDLGFKYTFKKTTFKVWTPVASHVDLVLFDLQTNQPKIIPMIVNEKGVWTTIVHANLDKHKYLYQAKINNQTIRTIDPYGISSDANGQHSYVIDLDKTRKKFQFKLKPFNSPNAAIIYEISIRDFSDYYLFKNKGKFLGIIEPKISSYYNHPVGLDYLKWLNITHVQILPMYDFATIDETLCANDKIYNWGYDPHQYNVPEGSYANDANDPYARIIELKEMIQTLHQNDIRVIMDVVYNHVYKPQIFAFSQLVPNYFFVYDKFKNLTAACGCGNDVNSSKKMVQKFILDSICFWINEYDVDGFRFDLMGILDLDTMLKVNQLIKKIKPDCLIYGEAWAMNNGLKIVKADLNHAHELDSIGCFNDYFRNIMRGRKNTEIKAKNVLLYANQKVWKNLLTGSIGWGGDRKMFLNPSNSINYVEVHDDYTLWDHLTAIDVDLTKAQKQKICLLVILFILVAQGISFLHSGMELFRTKKLIANSYNAPLEINRFPWSVLDQNFLAATLVKKMISLRKNHSCFWLNKKTEIDNKIKIWVDQKNVLFYQLDDELNQILIIFNFNFFATKIKLKEREWNLYLQNEFINDFQFNKNTNQIMLDDLSFCVLIKQK